VAGAPLAEPKLEEHIMKIKTKVRGGTCNRG
jgi:hypothetical protein